MNRFLSVVLLSILMVSGAWAYPAGEGAGDTHDGIIACPVVGKAVPHSALQRMATGSLQPQYPMTPVASCGQPSDLLAQVPRGNICRLNDFYWCAIVERPIWRPLGQPCCCFDGYGNRLFCGIVTDF